MRALLVPTSALVLLLLVSCASGGGARTFDHPLGVPQNVSVENRVEAPLHHTELPASADELAAEVPAIYRYLGLEAATARSEDPYTFFTPNMRITGQLYEGERNSAYIDCGSALQGARADIYDVEFAMATRLRPRAGGGTSVETRLEGLARDRFVNEAPVFCSGTGKLEGEIAELLRRGGVR